MSSIRYIAPLTVFEALGELPPGWWNFPKPELGLSHLLPHANARLALEQKPGSPWPLCSVYEVGTGRLLLRTDGPNAWDVMRWDGKLVESGWDAARRAISRQGWACFKAMSSDAWTMNPTLNGVIELAENMVIRGLAERVVLIYELPQETPEAA